MTIARRLLRSIAPALLLALLLGASGPAHGQAAAALSQVGERPSTACEQAPAAGAAVHHAGLVVIFEGGRTETYCIEFSEDEINGAELLQRSGLEVVFSSGSGFGAGICRIEGTGCGDPGDCFCQCRGASCAYWSYWTLHDGTWRYQPLGASQRQVHDGDVDAWVWGNGRSPPESDGSVCRAPAASPPRAQPTPTVAPRPTSPAATNGQPTSPAAASPTQRDVAATVVAAEAAVDATPNETAVHVVRGGTTAVATRRSDVSDASTHDGSGAPVGLIAFGAVAGALVIALGGIAVRRRIGG